MSALINRYRVFLIYVGIGLSGATFDFLLYWLLVALGMWPVLATFVSTSVGIVNNFAWNALFNFRTRDHLAVRFLSFYAVGGAGILLSMAIIWLCTTVGINEVVSKLISIPFVVIAQYIVNSRVTFRGYRTLGDTSTRSETHEVSQA